MKELVDVHFSCSVSCTTIRTYRSACCCSSTYDSPCSEALNFLINCYMQDGGAINVRKSALLEDVFDIQPELGQHFVFSQ